MCKVNVKCKNCEKLFQKYLSKIDDASNDFCSKTCSTIYNNRITPKRIKKQRFCKHCNVEITHYRNYKKTLCNMCYENKKVINKELKYYQNKPYHTSSKYAYIREHARNKIKNQEYSKKCCNCEYDIHVDICHIKPISSFDELVKIDEINDFSNLLTLCKNCHWEFDNKYLKLEDIKGRLL